MGVSSVKGRCEDPRPNDSKCNLLLAKVSETKTNWHISECDRAGAANLGNNEGCQWWGASFFQQIVTESFTRTFKG